MAEIWLSAAAGKRTRKNATSGRSEAYASLAETVRTAQEAVIALDRELLGLDARLEAPRVLSIDVSGAMAGLKMVLDMENQISTSLATGSARTANEGMGTYYDYGQPDTFEPDLSGSYAFGTDYVPRTGIYQLHQGEKVVPASENRSPASSTSTFTVTFAPGSIVINGSNKSPEELAASIAKPLQKKLDELAKKAGARS